ncbi:hypothetical protein D9619_003532 [Psilocybe cf. subviscida]|uniref:F-box domain-containing protein n=1 Tax=Psilocybe cf. subviscida TaxID=2480587 RepID=A0A8H5EUK6_9AGAR|nr:hypothetical protein D9619_003532 [Psilocybe cf. subviscida]
MTDNISPAVQNAVQRIDKQILHHIGPVHNLKSQRNALMPISQLPPEILGRIFHEVRGNNRHSQDDNRFWTKASYSEPSLEWVSVSHVSRCWRKVTLDDPNLWTNPPLKNIQWTMMMLERSRVAIIPAITLKVDELDERVVTALMPHIPRVSSLVIPNMARKMLKEVLSGLPSAAPELETLSISSLTKVTLLNSFRTACYGATFSSYDGPVAFPDDILCRTPKLRHLQLNDIIIKPDSPLLSNLTTLSMSGIPENRKPTPPQFKTMLESAPCLRRLILCGACPSTDNQQTEWTAAVLRMQHLEYLDIKETIPRLIFFFRFFSATHLLKRLIVHTDLTEESTVDLPLLFAALDQPYLHSIVGSSTDVRRLVVGTDDGEPYIQASRISLSERNLEPDEREMPEESESMTIWFHVDSDEIDEEDDMELTNTILSGLFRNFTWTGLCELDLSSLECASPRVLASTFGTIPTLRIIVADDDVAPSVIKAMNRRHGPKSQSNGSGSVPFPFPGLQHMDLGHTIPVQDDEDFKALCKCLRQRHEYGRPVVSLKFRHDYLEQQVFLLLKKYVEHVVLTPSRCTDTVVDSYSPYNHTWYM